MSDLHRSKRRNLIKGILLAGVSGVTYKGWAGALATGLQPDSISGKKRKLKPVLEGNWWLIGKAPADISPPSGDVLKKLIDDRRKLNNKTDKQYDDYGKILAANLTKIEPVDHHLFKADDGYWHLWGCVRNTSVGRLLYHWRAKSLDQSPWEETKEFIRSDAKAGECIDDWYGQEWLQSPYIIKEKSKYYMFYGGHSTGKDINGNPVSGDPPSEEMRLAQSQMCLMTSDDGVKWTRHKDKNGFSRVFVGPGQSRDPSLIKVGKTWLMYYTGDELDYKNGRIYVRTSEDLINWSPYKFVHHDSTFGASTWQHECPHVVYRDGYYYLFKTENYSEAKSHVYRSTDPYDFGTTTEAAQKLYVGPLACAAPEIYQSGGKEYISSNHNPPLGTQLCQLKWVEA